MNAPALPLHPHLYNGKKWILLEWPKPHYPKSGQIFLPMFTPVNSCLPMFTRVYLFLPLLTPVYLCHCILVLVFLCLPKCNRVYLCLHLFTNVYPCSFVFTYVFSRVPMITTVNSCLPMLTTICDPIMENHPYRGVFEFWVNNMVNERFECPVCFKFFRASSLVSWGSMVLSLIAALGLTMQ